MRLHYLASAKHENTQMHRFTPTSYHSLPEFNQTMLDLMQFTLTLLYDCRSLLVVGFFSSPDVAGLADYAIFCCCFFFYFNDSFQICYLNIYTTDLRQICRFGKTVVADHQSDISFSIPQGTLPWQPIFVGFIRRPEFR